MTIGEKIIAAIGKQGLAYDATDYVCAVPNHRTGWSERAASVIDALVAAHVEEQVRLRLDNMLCVVRKDGSYVLLGIKTDANGKKYVDMDDEIKLKMA